MFATLRSICHTACSWSLLGMRVCLGGLYRAVLTGSTCDSEEPQLCWRRSAVRVAGGGVAQRDEPAHGRQGADTRVLLRPRVPRQRPPPRLWHPLLRRASSGDLLRTDCEKHSTELWRANGLDCGARSSGMHLCKALVAFSPTFTSPPSWAASMGECVAQLGVLGGCRSPGDVLHRP